MRYQVVLIRANLRTVYGTYQTAWEAELRADDVRQGGYWTVVVREVEWPW